MLRVEHNKSLMEIKQFYYYMNNCGLMNSRDRIFYFLQNIINIAKIFREIYLNFVWRQKKILRHKSTVKKMRIFPI